MTQITDHLADIEVRVAAALERASRRPGDVTIVGASKQQSAAAIREAFAAGLSDFGESYLQEAIPKMDLLADLAIVWHFIGRIQANKTRLIAERFQCVHTVDRDKIADRLNAQRPRHAPRLAVYLQVNLGAEPQKAGVAGANLLALAEHVSTLPRLRLEGLMCIPPKTRAPEQAFTELGQLRDRLVEFGLDAAGLSMGMSADFEAAIENGSTCVRIGSALFGPRPNRN